MSRLCRLVVLAALVWPVGVWGAEGQAASPSEKRVGTKLEVEYGFVVERDGKPMEWNALDEVRTGDRFHVRLRSAQAVYTYLFVSRDERTFDLVLPSERRQQTGAQVLRNEWNTLPDQDWLRFDKARGIERIYLVISSAKVDDIEDLFATKRTPDAVDETWLVDLRNRLDGEGATTHNRMARSTRLTVNRRASGPAVIVETFTVRHK